MEETTGLPEIIPPGEYVLVTDEDGDGIELWVSGGGVSPAYTVVIRGQAVYVTEAQARHLLAMPGRPHDDRLDGLAARNQFTRHGDENPTQSPREDKP
jgi:hypothetical protein